MNNDNKKEKKKCGRPEKKIIIDDNTDQTIGYNTKIIDVVVKKINDKKYFVNEYDNYIYDISNHEHIGLLVNNKVIYKSDELNEDNYIY
tara:strand:- start:311 stop:577 length:267 start_codon:yes stop_codon:yes gene_type:complete